MSNEKTQHTPEPWWHNGLEIGDAPMMNIKVAKVSGANYEQAKSNAKRIVACVNACKGLSSEQLATLPHIIDEGTVAIQERAELLDALNAVIDCRAIDKTTGRIWSHWMVKFAEVVAKVEGVK